jgi:hypothetical protein
MKKHETIKVRIKTEAELLRMGREDKWQLTTVKGGEFSFKRRVAGGSAAAT